MLINTPGQHFWQKVWCSRCFGLRPCCLFARSSRKDVRAWGLSGCLLLGQWAYPQHSWHATYEQVFVTVSFPQEDMIAATESKQNFGSHPLWPFVQSCLQERKNAELKKHRELCKRCLKRSSTAHVAGEHKLYPDTTRIHGTCWSKSETSLLGMTSATTGVHQTSMKSTFRDFVSDGKWLLLGITHDCCF